MKRNVDLTENMIFSRNNTFGLIIARIKGKYPWIKHINEIKSDDYFSKQRQRIVTTGNSVERAKIEEFRQMDSQDTCDCCGASLIDIPWDRTYGVCKKCTEHYEWEKPKLWRLPEKVDRSSFRVIT